MAIAAVAAVAVVAVVVAIIVGVLVQGGDEEASQVVTPSEGKVKGLATAPVTIVEYADFQCSHCGNFARTTERLIAQDYISAGKVRLEFRNFPFLGQESVRAAEAALCANDQGKFWEYHDKLFANQSGVDRGAFSDQRLKQFASDLGLDRTAFDACLNSGQHKDAVQQEREQGARLGVTSTPYFLVNDQIILGNQPYEKFQQVIEAELAKGS